MAVQNPSFEVAGAAPGVPADWAITSAVASGEQAGFDTAPEEPVEDFEEEWGADPLVPSLVPGTNAVAAVFDADAVETFEVAWGADPVISEVTPANGIRAVFDGEHREDFEDGWTETLPHFG